MCCMDMGRKIPPTLTIGKQGLIPWKVVKVMNYTRLLDVLVAGTSTSYVPEKHGKQHLAVSSFHNQY